MGKYVADAPIKQIIVTVQTPKSSKVVIFGLTFKENCPDEKKVLLDVKGILKVNELNSSGLKWWR